MVRTRCDRLPAATSKEIGRPLSRKRSEIALVGVNVEDREDLVPNPTEVVSSAQPIDTEVALASPVLLLTVVEAARLLGIGRSTLYELMGTGDIETVHIGRAVRIPVDAVHAYVDRIRTTGTRGGRHASSVPSAR